TGKWFPSSRLEEGPHTYLTVTHTLRFSPQGYTPRSISRDLRAELVRPGTSGNLFCKTSRNTLAPICTVNQQILQKKIHGAQQPDICGFCDLLLSNTQCCRY
ncbi:hypothetical protein U0070_006729, partial [Myodes glareolus]